MLTYLFKEKFNQRTSLEKQRWLLYLLCHSAYAAWPLLNVQMSLQTSLTVSLEQRKYIGLENFMFILFIKIVLKTIKDD